jgi:hypothetical protein
MPPSRLSPKLYGLVYWFGEGHTTSITRIATSPSRCHTFALRCTSMPRKTSWEERKAAIRAKAQERYEARRDTLTADNFAFCIHCCRVWFRKPGTGYCPGERCSGTSADLSPWRQIQSAHPDYPEVPVPGDSYDM